jgi:gliding motility-associated-like protein
VNNYLKRFLIIAASLSSQYLPAQQLMYISDGATTYLANLETCEVEIVHQSNVVFEDITYNPLDQKLYGIGLDYLWEIDIEHDSIIYIMDAPDANALTCDRNGLMYAAKGGYLYTIDPQTKKFEEILSLDDYKSDGDLTFYDGELYLSVRENGLLKISLAEQRSFTKTHIATEIDSIWGMVTEFGECNEDFYLMANNDVYRLDENMIPRIHCEGIIECDIWGATSNTEVLTDFELHLKDRMALCENAIPLEIDASEYAATYIWDDGTTEPKLPVYRKGEYWVDVTVGKCTKRDTIEVFFQPAPTVDFAEDQVLCEGQVYTLDAENEGGKYIWQDGSEQSFFDVIEDGRYVVKVDVNGCFNSDTINIEFNYCAPSLKMPNVVTPNFDGMNDRFTPIEIENINQMKTSIYSRWGNKVFETDSQSIDWSPGDLPSGQYYYVIQYTEFKGQKYLEKGWVQVLR